MDTSPEYILMCQKAEGMQKAWNPAAGDFIYTGTETCTLTEFLSDAYCVDDNYVGGVKHNKNIVHRVLEFYDLEYYPIDPVVFWLPRQDQTIDMVGGCIDALMKFHKDIFNTGTDDIYDPRNFTQVKYFKTPEQLWLGYVMEKKYGKYWTGTEWE